MVKKPERYNGEYLDLLKRVIAASGMSTSEFARRVFVRDERDVRRWLSGEKPLPPAVVWWLLENGQRIIDQAGRPPEEPTG